MDAVLKNNFGLQSFRKGQREIILAILNQQDVMAVLPTGGGKSLCYQIPAVTLQRLVVVVSPLIALMRDQVAGLRRLNIPAGCLHSGQSEEDKRQIFRDIQKGGAYVLYLSPERVQKEGFKNWILSRPLALFAVDEAHCVSQWGHDFRQEYTQLSSLKILRPDVPVLALTASATPLVLKDIEKNLHLQKVQRMVHGFYRPNLYYQVENCPSDTEKLSYLIQALRKFPDGRQLIYCGTRKQTEELSRLLSHEFKSIGHYHAGLSSDQRTAIQEKYMRGELKTLVATNAFGMGIDQADVRLVVHYQLPANIDSLYQEMGRAGRDEKESTCLLLYAKADKGLQSFFIRGSEAPIEIKNSRWRNLEALVAYAEASECRNAEILTYFKDSQRLRRCGHCDICSPDSSRKVVLPAVPLATVASKVKLRSAKKSSQEVILDEVAQSRFERLRTWRRAKAQELDLPAFVVFSDRTLKNLAATNPRNIEELKGVHGIGETKAEKFGWDLLAELQS